MSMLRVPLRLLAVAFVFVHISSDAAVRRRAVRIPATPPAILSVTPSSAAIGGGTRLIIRGIGFLPGSQVSIDGAVVPGVQFDGSTLTLIAPPRINGFASLAVTNSYCSSEIRRIDGEQRFTVVSPLPGTAIGHAGDGGPARNAVVGFISGLAIDAAGNIYLVESGSRRIRAIKAP